MSHKVFVGWEHPLSRFHVYAELPLYSLSVTSIEMAFQVILLVQHGCPNLARQLARDQYFKDNPWAITSWVKTTGIEPTVDWICQSPRVIFDVLTHQWTQDSLFWRQFEMVMRKERYSKDGLEFIVCGSSYEMVFSCGLRQSQAQLVDKYPGFNIYGQLLGKLARQVREDKVVVSWPVGLLVSQVGLFSGSSYRKVVLLIGDSQLRYVRSLSSGDVLSISGGRYKDIVNAINMHRLSLSDYGIVIVNCGVNMIRYNSKEQRRQWECLSRLLACTQSNPNPPGVLISPAFPHPKVPGVDKATEIVRESPPPGSVVVDWATDGNPFLVMSKVKRELFERDGFHLNHKGFGTLWRRWCEYIPDLKLVQYKLSPSSQARKKLEFTAEMQSGQGSSRKRKYEAK